MISSSGRLATPKLLFNTAVAQVRSALFGDEFRIPVLFALAGEDRLVDPEASARAFGRIRAKDKEILRYPAMYHALSIETGKEAVFEDILKWTKRRL